MRLVVTKYDSYMWNIGAITQTMLDPAYKKHLGFGANIGKYLVQLLW